jgi:hypothetical protein
VSYMDNYTDKLFSYRCVIIAWTITQTSCWVLNGVCVQHGQLHRQVVPFEVCMSDMDDNYTGKLLGSYRCVCLTWTITQTSCCSLTGVCVSYKDNYTDKLFLLRCVCLTWIIKQTGCSLTGVYASHGQLHRQVVLLQVCMSDMDNYTDKLLGCYRCVCPTWTITQTSCSLTGVCL